MADILVFYARKDEKLAGNLAALLAISFPEFSVWTDKEISHGAWDEAVDVELEKALCAVPIWSKHSSKPSSRAKKEAVRASESRVPLIHTKIDDSKRRCQPNAGQSSKGLTQGPSGRRLTPLGQGGGAHLLEAVAAC